EVCGLPWKACAVKKERNGSFHLGVFLYHRQSDSDIWSIDVSGSISLLNTDGEQKKNFTVNTTFNREVPNWGCPDLCEWENLTDEAKVINTGC
ncbi:hypothetical protein PMAYCL1PPCAC_24935, partial [Pristionchus mayeri]